MRELKTFLQVAEHGASSEIGFETRLRDVVDLRDDVAGADILLPSRAAGSDGSHRGRRVLHAHHVGDRGEEERRDRVHDSRRNAEMMNIRSGTVCAG